MNLRTIRETVKGWVKQAVRRVSPNHCARTTCGRMFQKPDWQETFKDKCAPESWLSEPFLFHFRGWIVFKGGSHQVTSIFPCSCQAVRYRCSDWYSKCEAARHRRSCEQLLGGQWGINWKTWTDAPSTTCTLLECCHPFVLVIFTCAHRCTGRQCSFSC